MSQAGRRILLASAIALGALPVQAQSLPGGVSATEAMTLYQTLTPQQRQMLANRGVKSMNSISPSEALAWYQTMTPQQKQMAKDWAKQHYGNDPGMKEKLKSWYKAWRGQ